MTVKGDRFLGCQIWIEPADTEERIAYLVKTAKESGLGWLRTFLMWPWIEKEKGKWDFGVFDALFDSCARHDILIKATLTANSGPWHTGAPSLLHSFTGFFDPDQWRKAEEYTARCAERYRNHPALGQWILWNEPGGGRERSEETRALWQEYLRRRYHGEISALNQRWRTGYADFGQAPFPEDVPSGGHHHEHWLSYAHDMDGFRFSMQWLAEEIRRIAMTVRRIDPQTPLCINPPALLANQAAEGTDPQLLGKSVDVMGASYHPAWQFTFAPRFLFPALMSVGVKKAARHPDVKAVEVTEVQAGNTLHSSNKPCAAMPDEYARFCLAGIFAGAQSVTGWLLNTRSYDFEAGDWGLLDDMDKPSPRSRMTKKLSQTLDAVLNLTGGFAPAPARVFVGFDPDAQVLEAVESARCGNIPGRRVNDSAYGQALISCRLMQAGVQNEMCRLEDLPQDGAGKLLIISQVSAWKEENAARILAFAESGGTVVFDAACGRKTPDAALYRPWPGVLGKAIGISMRGLETDPEGYAVTLHGGQAGRWLLARALPEFDRESGWHAWEEPRFEKDLLPCVWERPFEKGKVIFVNGLIAPSLLYGWEDALALKYALAKISRPWRMRVRPVSYTDSAYALENSCEYGKLWGILSQPLRERSGRMLRVHAPAGKYRELWTGQELIVTEEETDFPAEDGIVILWKAPE